MNTAFISEVQPLVKQKEGNLFLKKCFISRLEKKPNTIWHIQKCTEFYNFKLGNSSSFRIDIGTDRPDAYMHEPLKTATTFLSDCAPWLGNQHSQIPRTLLQHWPGSQSLRCPRRYHVMMNIWKGEWLPIYHSSSFGATGTVQRAGGPPKDYVESSFVATSLMRVKQEEMEAHFHSSLKRYLISRKWEESANNNKTPLKCEVVQTLELWTEY